MVDSIIAPFEMNTNRTAEPREKKIVDKRPNKTEPSRSAVSEPVRSPLIQHQTPNESIDRTDFVKYFTERCRKGSHGSKYSTVFDSKRIKTRPLQNRKELRKHAHHIIKDNMARTNNVIKPTVTIHSGHFDIVNRKNPFGSNQHAKDILNYLNDGLPKVGRYNN